MEELCLLRYQLCFDLVDSRKQAFVQCLAGSPMTFVAECYDDERHHAIKQSARFLAMASSLSNLPLSFLHKYSNVSYLVMGSLENAMEEHDNNGGWNQCGDC